MPAPKLVELAADAADAADPGLVPLSMTNQGGVDPLGLRQINFDLMDRVFPGLNNTAGHIRPYTVVAWAWRRAAVLAGDIGHKPDELRDFVDRIEVLFAWSQFLVLDDPPLPGRDVLAALVQSPKYRFGGTRWEARRERRRYSTALSAPINYGPGLKSLGWLRPSPSGGGMMMVDPALTPALDALEARLGKLVEEPAFSKLGAVVVPLDVVRRLGKAWRWDRPTKAERQAMAEALVGDGASTERRLGMQWAASVASSLGVDELDTVRDGMADVGAVDTPEEAETAERWRRVQIRQLFRLSLEGFFFWTLRKLEARPATTAQLVTEFLKDLPKRPRYAGPWLEQATPAMEPGGALRNLQSILWAGPITELPAKIVAGLSLSLAEAQTLDGGTESSDRLPLARAAREAAARAEQSPSEFLRHVLESWVIGQHVYWCVGRGLQDARAGRRSMLRLRIVLEEDGWTLAPRTSPGPPAATPDRLRTALSLLSESGLVENA